MVSFKELCGLTPAANMKQCILTVSSWLTNSERALRVMVNLSEAYPTMEAHGPIPELLRKVLTAYDTVGRNSTVLALVNKNMLGQNMRVMHDISARILH